MPCPDTEACTLPPSEVHMSTLGDHGGNPCTRPSSQGWHPVRDHTQMREPISPDSALPPHGLWVSCGAGHGPISGPHHAQREVGTATETLLRAPPGHHGPTGTCQCAGNTCLSFAICWAEREVEQKVGRPWPIVSLLWGPGKGHALLCP